MIDDGIFHCVQSDVLKLAITNEKSICLTVVSRAQFLQTFAFSCMSNGSLAEKVKT